MRFPLLFLIAGLSTISLAQPYESISIQTEVRSIWVELESLNQLQIRRSKDAGLIRLQYNNHDNYPDPVLIDKNDLIELNVTDDTQALPQAQQNKYRAGQPLYPNYILEIPLNIQLKLSYKQGNIKINNFVGELELYLDHGTVKIDKLSGSARIQSYGGVIDCTLNDASVNIESKEGEVRTTIQDKGLKISHRSISGRYGLAKNNLDITTVVGKVTLSRPEDK